MLETHVRPVFRTKSFRLMTNRAPQLIDITEEVMAVVAESEIYEGQVLVYSRHTTAAIKVNEHEPELLKDLERFLRRMAPADGTYFHNDFSVRTENMTDDEWPNAHAHCQHLLLSTSETIPVLGGCIQLGRWQRIFLVELDHPRLREVIVQVMGQ